MNFSGTVHKYGDNINTDVIIPARYCNTLDEKELAAHCMADIDEEFPNKVQENDIIVGGNNFGCGSSREMAVTAIKASGISCIIAKSFARIFYRNAINTALPLIECSQLVDEVKNGEKLIIKLDEGTIINTLNNKHYDYLPPDKIAKQIFIHGGLIEYVKAKQKNVG